MYNTMFYITVLLFLIPPFVPAHFTAYDCTSPGTNYTSLSVVDVGECNWVNGTTKDEDMYVQVVQKPLKVEIDAILCAVTTSIRIQECNRFENDHLAYFSSPSKDKLTRSECIDFPKTKILPLIGGSRRFLDTFPIKQDILYNAYGHWDDDGDSCTRSDQPFYWKSVKYDHHVMRVASVADMRQVKLVYYPQSKSVIDPITLVKFDYRDGYGYDSRYGAFVWDIKDDCDPSLHIELFAGVGNVKKSKDESVRSVYIQSGKFALATRILATTSYCDVPIYTTRFNEIFINIQNKKFPYTFRSRKEISPTERNIELYFEAKIEYSSVLAHDEAAKVRNQLTMDLCQVERSMLINRAALISESIYTIQDDYFPSKGIMIHQAGHAVYLMQCVPVEVNFINTGHCYEDLPVNVSGKTMFMDARTSILKDNSVRTICSDLLPNMFFIKGKWYKMTPNLIPSTPPAMLNPNKIEFTSLFESDPAIDAGIYSPSDVLKTGELLALRFSRTTEQGMTMNALNGLEQDKKFRIDTLVDGDSFRSTFSKGVSYIWGLLYELGVYYAMAMGVMFVWNTGSFLVKLTLNILDLYDVVGLSWRLICALSTTLTSRKIYERKTNGAPTAPKNPYEQVQLELNDMKEEDHIIVSPKV